MTDGVAMGSADRGVDRRGASMFRGKSARKLTGRKVLMILVGFFGLMAVVNAAFVYLALTSWSGLETEDAYRKGVTYNEVLAKAEAQRALGWETALRVVPGDGENRLQLTLADGQGRPLTDLTAEVDLRRPAREGMDRHLSLTANAAGLYGAPLDGLDKGQWKARVVIRGHGVAPDPYIIETRILVK